MSPASLKSRLAAKNADNDDDAARSDGKLICLYKTTRKKKCVETWRRQGWREITRGKTGLLQLFTRRRNVGINLKRIVIETPTTQLSFPFTV